MLQSRVHQKKVGLVATALMLGVAGLLFGVSTSAGAGGPGPQPGGLDHFLCYTVSAIGFQPPTGVKLSNQFTTTAPMAPKKIGAANLHCNPVNKILSTGQAFPPQNPDAHLLCYKIAVKPPTPHTVVITNQFGQGTFTLSKVSNLCLPTWKSLTGPPGNPAPQPPGLDHFTCYPVKPVAGTPPFQPPAGTRLVDQFAPNGTVVKIGKPKLLCLPTTKILATGQTFPAQNPAAHLLCFTVSKTPFPPQVFDQNQFGTGQVTIKKTSYLCLPSFKDVIQ
jgi:hypothetical protein